MLNALLGILCAASQTSFINELDALAKARDIDGLRKFATNDPVVAEKLRYIKSGGAYGSGRFGWSALPLDDADEKTKWVVFSTRVTNEDIGEQVYRVANQKLMGYLSESDPMGFRIDNHNFEIWFDIPRKSVRIVDVVRFRRTGIIRPSLMFRMSNHYKVSAIQTLAGKQVKFFQAGGVVSVTAPKEPEFTYKITYSGIVNQPRFAACITGREAQLTEDYWYPNIARNAVTYQCTIHSPKSWIAVAQGEEISAFENQNERITQYRMDLPSCYLSLSAAPYRFASKVYNGINFTTWSITLTNEEMELQNELAAPVIDFYSKTLSPYPFKRWGSLDSTTYSGGALEAYSHATYATGWLPDDDSHEPAHTWWGGIIPNTYLRSMWNESFADYCQGLYARNVNLGSRSERAFAFISSGRPSSAYNQVSCAEGSAEFGPASSSVGYGKGAQVLQVLEYEIGTEKMIAGLREWLRTHKRGEVGEWEDFERVVNRVSGKDLKQFFDQWVRGKGWPDFNIESAEYRDGELKLNFAHTNAPYALSLDILLQYTGGDREYRTITLPSTSNPSLTLKCKSKPSIVSVDPWRKLLRRMESNEEPVSLERVLRNAKPWIEKGRAEWHEALFGRRTQQNTDDLTDFAGKIIVASPETVPAIKPLFEKVGFVVSGNTLTYKGTKIDLRQGGAMAVVNLADEKNCVIAIGKTRRPMNFGRARLCVCDDLGRFLRGETEPKTEGFLTASVK